MPPKNPPLSPIPTNPLPLEAITQLWFMDPRTGASYKLDPWQTKGLYMLRPTPLPTEKEKPA